MSIALRSGASGISSGRGWSLPALRATIVILPNFDGGPGWTANTDVARWVATSTIASRFTLA